MSDTVRTLPTVPTERAAEEPVPPEKPEKPPAGPVREPAARTAEAPAGPSPGHRVLAALRTAVRRSVALVAFFALWEVAPRTGLVDDVFLPPFSRVVRAWLAVAGDGRLWEHVQASAVRSLSGLALAVLIAIPLGVLIGWYRGLSELLDPLLELFRNTAALALLPVFVLLLGLGESSKISLVLFACTWPILLNTISGVRSVDPLLIKATRSLGFGPLQMFRKVVVPAALPTVFTGIRLAGASSILVLVAAEMAGAKAGLGYMISAAQFNFDVPQMYAGIVTISILGLVFNQVLVALERHFSRWRAPQ